MENSVEQGKRKVPVIEVDGGRFVHLYPWLAARAWRRHRTSFCRRKLIPCARRATMSAMRCVRALELGAISDAFGLRRCRRGSEFRNRAIFPLEPLILSGIAAGKL